MAGQVSAFVEIVHVDGWRRRGEERRRREQVAVVSLVPVTALREKKTNISKQSHNLVTKIYVGNVGHISECNIVNSWNSWAQ